MEEDKRFANVINDPKFRRIPKGERKVKIDKRFQSMFNDKKFKVKYTVDKRGRPVSHSSSENLRRYYELSSEDESEEETPQAGKSVEAPQIQNDDQESELKTKHKTDKQITKKIQKKLKNLSVDYARGESALNSESSSDDELSEEDVSETDEIDHKWGELDQDAETTEEATYRLAACNADWDRIKAVDLMVLFNSFLPPGGVIKSVKIYPSEFGKKRLQDEETKGPIELVEKNNQNKDDNETEEGSNYHMERLRQYQLNRLKYYYAVITFDSANSANKVYTECDGMEYESSATKIDLRFIPDDMSFEDTPKEICEKLPELSKYQPRFFTTTALQQAKVDLTWDETNPDRLEIAEKINSGKLDDLNESDLQNYLASSSGEEDSDNDEKDESDDETDNPIDKYRSLLQDIEVKEKEKQNKDVEMEISWGLDVKQKTEKLVKQKIAENEGKTPFEAYLEKRKEKRKEKRELKKQQKGNEAGSDNESEDSDVPDGIDLNDPYFAEEFNKKEFKQKNKKVKPEQNNLDNNKNAELELLLMDETDNKKHFSMKKIQKQESEKNSKSKKKKKQLIEDTNQDEFEINVEDQRFSALFTSHHFNLDPTDPHFKKTKAMDTLIKEKLKRRNEDNTEITAESKKVKKDAELSVLVKSVKRKAQAYKNKNK